MNNQISGLNQLIHFKGEVSGREIDSILEKIENAIDDVKWMKSVLRVSYDLLISRYGSADIVEYILGKANGSYKIYCIHNKVPLKVSGFIVKAINKLKGYNEDKLRDLIKRMAARHSPVNNKETFFEDIIWSIFNIYRRKYASLEVNLNSFDNEFVAMEFKVNFDSHQ
jgi:hypothetical protein